jgi:hypothetical protein
MEVDVKWDLIKEKTLCRMAELGWSASMAAEAFSTTRSAILGKAWRIGLSFKDGTRSQERAVRAQDLHRQHLQRHLERTSK